MSQITPAAPAPLKAEDVRGAFSNRELLGQLLWLALPVLAEHILHMVVGLTDTYLANHLPDDAAAATAAVGTVSYILWFTGMIVGMIGTGSTAIIARATGARHRSLANSVCGQSITSSILLGVVLGSSLFLFAEPIAHLSNLRGAAHDYSVTYMRLLAVALPFSTLMFVANACLRGAGDTLTPAIAMILVDVVNIIASFALTYGWWGLPEMGFQGIAIGTVLAYVAGGLLQFGVLVHGRGGIRLHLHRLRPHWLTLKRLMRIGIPTGVEGLLSWMAQYMIVIVINGMDATNAVPAAHINAIRIESISFMCGFAVAAAAATMVGQSLGMNNPRRATRSAYLAYAVGGAFMTLCGLAFIFAGDLFANWLSANERIADLTARCLFITGFIQCGFAAAAIFGGALRGAGDTLAVMILSLSSILFIRLAGSLFVGVYLGKGLVGIWVVLAIELFLRGVLIYARFLHGGWRHVKV